jgi:predicted alpha/beta hydrolase
VGPSAGVTRKKSRASAAPAASSEEVEIHTHDGVALRAVSIDPPPGAALLGTCVLAHAMFARKSSFGRADRPGLATSIAARGYRTIAFDFRGHGESVLAPSAQAWGYDDLVRQDLPAVVACARARGEGLPLIVIGHSLGGHVALAAQGIGLLDADAIVGLGANVWLPALEPSLVRRAAKRATARATLATLALLRGGRLPARRLRLGSDDASARYMHDLLGVVRARSWKSADGRDDYLASLAHVKVPVANVLGARDWLMCTPRAGEAFVRHCRGPVEVFHAPGGHADLVTDAACQEATLRALAWAVEAVEKRQARP